MRTRASPSLMTHASPSTRPRAVPSMSGRAGPASARGHSRGAAVIIAMLVAALAATVAMAIAAEQQRWFAGVAARRDQVQAQSLAQAGVQWTRAILREDQVQGGAEVDYVGEPWSFPLPPTPLENGVIEGRIVDAQGLLNVNGVLLPGTQGDVTRAALARLFSARGVPASEVDALAAYASDGAGARGDDAWYARQPTPYLRAAAQLTRPAELGAVRGFDDAALARVLPFVSALPPDATLNVNTAPAEVLAAVLGLDDTRLAALVAARTRQPFTTVADFRNRLPQGVTLPDERAFSVRSDWFLVTVRARQGDIVAQARALLHRNPQGWPAIAWQTIE